MSEPLDLTQLSDEELTQQTHDDLYDGLAEEVEALGYGAIWLGGSPTGDLEAVEGVLDATKRIPVATGIVERRAPLAVRRAPAVAELVPNWTPRRSPWRGGTP